MTDIDLKSYFELTEEQKQVINEIILTDLYQAPKGVKMTFAAANYNVEKVLAAVYKGYLGELKVLEHLQKKNPDQNWRFIDNNAGYYHLNYQVSNKPDLINDSGLTVEVKSYTIYSNTIYFVSCLSEIDRLWQQFFHGADYVIVIDFEQKLAVLFNYDQFKANVLTETNNFNSIKTTYKLNITSLIKANLFTNS